jgi:brefeldin A-resistance guanine nucleotide exchange factor 1
MPAVQDSSQILALDAVLSFVSSMTSRQESEEVATQSAATWPLDYPTIDSLVYSKGRKAAILAGAERFNAKPKDGMAYLEKEGFIDYSGKNGISKEKSIATFLKSCPRLDKKLLGDYISRPDNIQVLEAFLSLFDFRGKPVGEAIREMLESFRLPGESQQINRIAETFSKIYFNEAQPPEIASEDAVYVLTYSVIMLNTDLHNKQVKKRMALEDYRKNLRGVNDGQDFDPEYLSQIYDSIRRREIVMPEEHVGQLGFDFTWKELLRKSRTAGPLLEAHNSAVFDKAMFELAWRPVVAAIAHAFSTFQDEHLLERAISGFRQCAVLASRFGMVDMFDFMLRVLAGATGLLDASLPREMQIQGLQINGTPTVAIPNNAVVEVEDQKVTVSPLSVRFGMNFKGQLAAVVLFTIANGNGDAVRHGWAEIFEIFKNLFANSLLPPSMLEMTDFTSESGSVTIPLKPKKPAGPQHLA